MRYLLTAKLAFLWFAATMMCATAMADDVATHAGFSVTEWMERLRKPASHHEACQALRAIGEPAVPALLKALDNRAYQRWHGNICSTLGKIGDKKAVKPLIRVVQERKDNDLRRAAMFALGQLGRSAAAAIPVLTAAFKDESPIIRVIAVSVIRRIEPKTPRSTLVPVLVEAAGADDWEASRIALSILTDIEGVRAVDLLASYLKHANDAVRRKAAESLGSLGPKAREALPALIDALDDSPDGPMQTVAKAVADVSLGDKQTVSALIAIVRDRDDRRDRGAIMAVRNMGAAGKAVVPSLITAASDAKRHIDTRKEAIGAMLTIAPGSPEVADALAGLAGDADENIRMTVYWTLSNAKIDPALMAPVFVKGLTSDNEGIRRSAGRFLVRQAHGNQNIMDMLIDVLKRNKGPDCVAVAWAMRYLGDGAKRAVPALIECLGSEDTKVCHEAAMTLGIIGPVTRQVVPSLCAALKDPSTASHRGVVWAISRIGVPAKAAIPTLIQALTDDPKENPLSRHCYHVLEALAGMGRAAKEAAPAMVTMLTHEHRLCRLQSVRGLVAIGCADEHAGVMIPVLREIMTEKHPRDFRLDGIEIARQLGPKAEPLLPVLIPMMKNDNARIAAAAGKAIKAIAETKRNGTAK